MHDIYVTIVATAVLLQMPMNSLYRYAMQAVHGTNYKIKKAFVCLLSIALIATIVFTELFFAFPIRIVALALKTLKHNVLIRVNDIIVNQKSQTFLQIVHNCFLVAPSTPGCLLRVSAYQTLRTCFD